MTEYVYVVMGETGEYSDRLDWPVVAYLSEADAEAHVQRAEAWLREHHFAMGSDRVAYKYGDYGKSFDNPHDPDMQLDYTGTRYSVMKVLLSPPLVQP